jgi:hypothetical protein
MNEKLLSHKDQTRLTVDDVYQVFFTEHRIKTDKKQSALNAVNVVSKDLEPVTYNLYVAPFQPQQNPSTRTNQKFNNRGNHSRG